MVNLHALGNSMVKKPAVLRVRVVQSRGRSAASPCPCASRARARRPPRPGSGPCRRRRALGAGCRCARVLRLPARLLPPCAASSSFASPCPASRRRARVRLRAGPARASAAGRPLPSLLAPAVSLRLARPRCCRRSRFSRPSASASLRGSSLSFPLISISLQFSKAQRAA